MKEELIEHHRRQIHRLSEYISRTVTMEGPEEHTVKALEFHRNAVTWLESLIEDDEAMLISSRIKRKP